MQRVSAFLPSWDKRNSGASNKPGGFFGWTHRNSHAPKLPSSINIAAANAHRVQREAYWPAPLDAECDKAARILKSFCTDGYLVPDDAAASPEPPTEPAQATRKIPKRVIQNAAGIAVFSCMRSGLWMTGSGGSGILIARKSDGTWSPPSGIMLHTPTLSFIIGVDVYDCVLVVNNLAALESITRPRVTLGEDVGLTNGPSVPLDSDELHINWRELGNTVLAYMKARGQHQAVNLHGCILAERANENERFYESTLTQMDILSGNVGRHVDEANPLFEVIKMAEGRTDFNSDVVSSITGHSAPGDALIATPKSSCSSPRPSFGIPKADDPDPFGVLALEMAGLEIREAGSRYRPTSSQLDHACLPLSPTMSKFSRQSTETFATRSNRGSVMSSRTVKSQATDGCTRTDFVNTPETTPSPGQSDDGHARASIDRMPELKEDDEVDYTRVDFAPLRSLSQQHSMDAILSAGCLTTLDASHLAPPVPDNPDADRVSQASSVYTKDEEEETIHDADDEDDLDDEDAGEHVVIEVAAAQPTSARAIASRVIHARGNVVTIAKRLPPPLPMRSPARNLQSDKAESGADASSAASSPRQNQADADVGVNDGQVCVGPVDKTSDEHETKESTVAGSEMNKAHQAVTQGPEGDELQSEQRVSITSAAEEDGSDKVSEKRGGELTSAETSLGAQLDMKVPMGHGNESAEMVREEEVDCLETVPEKSNVNEDVARDESGHEQADNSDSNTHEKHTSSIYTGATDDRWSCDGSSATTPTSERRFSMLVGEMDAEKPAKSVGNDEAEEHAAVQRLGREPEKPVFETFPTAIALSTTT